jgi:hypothetical protein
MRCFAFLVLLTAGGCDGASNAPMPDLATLPPGTDMASPSDMAPPRRHLDHPLVDQDQALSGFAEIEWYKDNIPFLDVPDSAIFDVYYYRWSSYKRNLHYTQPDTGYIVSEFVHAPGYASAFGGINAAAGHHIYEGRWLKTQRYLDDYERYWLRGPGMAGAHQYSFWAADAAYARYLVNGDAAFVTGILEDLVRQYNDWDSHFDAQKGLYWQVPVWDAMEYTIGSYQTSDPYHGGAGFRPTINAYQYGDAMAIAAIATLTGDSATASTFSAHAAALKSNMQAQLWDSNRNFFFHMMTNNAAQSYPHPEGTLLDGREQIGFVPWYFNMPDQSYSSAWKSLLDPQAFAAPYGPTTAERRHHLFMDEALSGCCRWDGPSWPYATSQTLTAMANLLDNYSQSVVTKDDYFAVLDGYAKAQHKGGQPYVAEALDADHPTWIYDSFNHSEHYNHSTFNDLIITGLIGLRPRADDQLELRPLVPDSWSYFCLENVLYHGHRLTIVWDKDGSRYGLGPGLVVFQDDDEIASSPTLAHLTVPLAAMSPPPAVARLDNIAANPLMTGYPAATASCTNSGAPGDDAKQVLDGIILYDDIPNSRWTNYGCATASPDWLQIDFGSPKSIGRLTLHLYDDGHGVRAPSSYDVQYWDGAQWAEAANQSKSPATPQGRMANQVTFTSVVASKFRVLLTNAPGAASGVTELEVWR